MPRNKIIPYNPALRTHARELRKNSTLSEILLWQQIRSRKLGVQFHRQVPVHEFILDFFCHELQLAIEVDGNSHHNSEQHERDLYKDYILCQLGIQVLRIDDLDIKFEMESVIQFLAHRIEQRFESLPSRGDD